MFGINGSELIVLIVLAFVVLGPEKLPEYTRALAQGIRKTRDMAEGAKTQFKEETGTDFDSVDWRRYDPRQYDPRRIIRDALREPADGSTAAARAQELTGVAAEDMHGGLSAQDLRDMDPRSLFRRPSGDGSTAAPAGGGASAPSDAPTPEDVPSAAVPVAAASPSPAGAVAAAGAAAALLASGRAEEVLTDPAPLQHMDTDPDPLDLLGKAPAPFDVDAT